MASTNKTPHLQLNQWVPSDPFLMEDMNADNVKIDEAIAAAPIVKLIDITTAGVSPTGVEINLGSIDINEYLELKLYFICQTQKTYSLRINKISTMSYNPKSGSSNYAASDRCYVSTGTAGVMFLGTYITIVEPNRITQMETNAVTIANLKTLDIIDSVPAGTRFILMGVRR